jgi:hypothetical protein
MKRKKNKGVKLSQSTPFPIGAKLQAVNDPYGNEIIVRNYLTVCSPEDVHSCKCSSKGTMIEDTRRLHWCIYQDRYSNREPAILKWKLIERKETKCKSILKEKIKAILASKPIPIYKRKLTHGKN